MSKITVVAQPGRDVPRTELEKKMLGVAEQVLDEAKKCGATAAEASIGQGQGLSVTVRHGEVETVEHNRDKSLDVTVYFDHRGGCASTTDFSSRAIADSVAAACTIARYTEEDPYNGLADPELLAREFPDLDLDHPWQPEMEQAIEQVRICEQAALDLNSRITNSEGATLNSHDGCGLYANSLDFAGFSRGSRHGLSCAVIGGEGDAMQRDYWYDSARDHNDLQAPAEVGRLAAERTVRRLGAQKIKSAQLPVVFEAPVAASLLSHLVSAISGGS
ncbi:MAG: DNA gyrase modulator, partial [Pseudomonadota bacterium]|nr:DNA gyrase modulator [Pseudomonadota bacterium]